MDYYVGIDLGGTNIVAGVVDSDYKILAKAKCKTNVPRPEAELCDSMVAVTLEAVEKAGLTINDIKSVGIGVPGAVNPETGIVEYAVNLFLHNWKLVEMMQERLNKKVCIENDANAAAYGEYLAGALKNTTNGIAVTLGTGIGGGIIINGKLYSGSNYAGGELGHMVIVYDGLQCQCGRKGCWEAYASASGLIRLTKKAIEENPEKAAYMLGLCDNDTENLSGRTAFIAKKAGDELGAQVVDKYIGYLACGLVNMINIFQPDVICIGGGISHEGENLTEPLNKITEAERYTKHNNKQTRICTAQLGNDAGIIGAALLG